MRHITMTIYPFDELSKEAKSRAIDKLWDINVGDSQWHENVIEQATADLQVAGFEDADIRYRGFWSQGDGASFTAHVDLHRWLRANFLVGKYRTLDRDAAAAELSITQSGHYSHEYTMDILARYHGENDKAQTQLQQLSKQILDDARDQARAIYRNLEREYTYQTSDEQVIEAIRANGYEFTALGTLAPARISPSLGKASRSEAR